MTIWPKVPMRNTDDQHSNVSRRDFVRTTAISIGGLGAGIVAGRGLASAAAAQSVQPPAAADARGAHEKLCITVSPSGQGSFVPAPPGPRTIAAHADAALQGFNAGAAIVHLRGERVTQDPKVPQGRRGPNIENWRQLTEAVRSRCDIVINYGSSAMEPAVRKPLLALKPEAGSFLVGHHYGGMAVTRENQRQYAIDHLEAGVLPEVEIFHTGDLANLNALIDTGLLRPPYCVTLFLEYERDYYRVPATLLQLQSMLELLPPNTHWTACVRGPKHLEMAAHAIALGGHVRTGLENDVELAPGRPARTQAECVERIVQLARSVGREVATPREARQMLGLPRKPEKANS
ncbi:MAG: hypothetical protein A3H29_01100 [Acidobacteria bacterium RIFCSPLOWO2_02_FULL_67_21]|nr:MAG: hypothetical protein A3H29_01100 [Acidobacteria bacterium RIFCSPLOWO2_02_FULL_67_21]